MHPDDAGGFEDGIGKTFASLRRSYPNTPLLLMSGLAEGADRIAVRAAIRAAIPYIAVLPMPVGVYRQEFTAEASDAEFEDLRKGARSSIELPAPSWPSYSPQGRQNLRSIRVLSCIGHNAVTA